mmetsp:Transcript_18254/g.24058  ORF Transcript_18254/g.24058 Transcript_18254/m.24058 type:complete len:289 (-) Transcript_18254:217-1083(-)|eukprot:CAMPEP_0117790948 /NCGR_PEP_ID=MMETSP0948-20121206/8570_1 /TAXON_ID=44440 /ORGANISM="Chattonella subsalsa, Strain CCMP2191" /LENGTH=288 /DNA_ID=CAMNT_0005620917 /DNA_START=8 /DNA_END=874 /DNA_ORIENTATION=+
MDKLVDKDKRQLELEEEGENTRKKPKNNQNKDEKVTNEPITKDGEMPQKKFYRSRAHCNPLSHNDLFDYPVNPAKINWSEYFPNAEDRPVSFIDVGCGFGGLTVSLAKTFPDKLVLGMEIRPKVCEYVRLRIEALRKEEPGLYCNAAVIRTNAMRYLPNFFRKAEIEKMFFCFPDPHFKAKNHRRRIVNTTLLTEYAYFLKPGGHLYCITDVEELHNWHVAKCTAHPCFRPLSEEEMENDPCVPIMRNETEESKKVERAGSNKYYAVFERIGNDSIPVPEYTDVFGSN